MKSEYEKIFEQRGSDYDLAMQRFPNARDAEFSSLFDGIDITPVKQIADIPSGGGYLSAFVPQDCYIDAIEPCGEFHPENAHQLDVGLDQIVLSAQTYDLIVCLAAIHHIEAKSVFLASLYKALKPGAYLCIADVPRGSSIGEFLDDFAGKHNGTGHSGMYLETNTVPDILQPLGAEILCCEEKPCPWFFDNESDMLAFCRLLFGLKAVGEQDLLKALDDYVGFSRVDKGISLNWRLLYLTVRKPC